MIVLSHFRCYAPASLANHRHYADLQGYRHEVVDASAMAQTLLMSALYRYEVLLNTLRHAQAGQIVLLLSENAAIIEPVALERLMAGRDLLLVRTDKHELPQTDVQIWRNTPKIQEIVLQLVKKSRLGGTQQLTSEAALFEGLETWHYTMTIEGICPVMQSGCNYDPLWSRVATFAISIDDRPDNPAQKTAIPRFRNTLIEHINSALVTGIPLFSFPQYRRSATAEEAERSVYNPGCAIAMVMLYTPNIKNYACIAEDNIRRYCETHGYTLYIHRDIPYEIDLKATGNWYKPFLLHGYMEHHEWVIWLDSDILITSQEQKLEPLLVGRDWLLAHDLGQWLFNAGLMGFRRSERNHEMLYHLMERITLLADKSCVYASEGDQSKFIDALQETWQVQDKDIVDMISLNTPWMFWRLDSFSTHYYDMWPEMRLLMMAHDEAFLLRAVE